MYPLFTPLPIMWKGPPPRPVRQDGKFKTSMGRSFLVLFFKKERAYFLEMRPSAGPDRLLLRRQHIRPIGNAARRRPRQNLRTRPAVDNAEAAGAVERRFRRGL